jgi:hypothetical protein
MGSAYEASQTTGAIRQGEVLGPIVRHDAAFPPRRIPKETQVTVDSLLVDLVLVLSPDCDLNWDHEMRFVDCWDSPDEAAHGVEQVLMCPLQRRGEIRWRFHKKGDLWDRVDGNHDRRYHHIPGAQVEELELYLHPHFIDFKKAISMPTEQLYDGVLAGDIERVARLPDYYLHHLIHRFYGFLSRVALPDEAPE